MLSSNPMVPTAITTLMQQSPHTHTAFDRLLHHRQCWHKRRKDRGRRWEGQRKGSRCTSSCDDGWLWNLGKRTMNDFIIISTVISIHKLIWTFWHPCWLTLEMTWQNFILELACVSILGFWPKFKPRKGRKVQKKLADLAWTRKSHLYKYCPSRM